MFNNIGIHSPIDHRRLATRSDVGAYFGAADVEERGIDKAHISDSLLPQSQLLLLSHLITWARIDNQMVTREKFVVGAPSVEGEPVVGTDDEMELMLGIFPFEDVERIDRIVGLGQIVLDVGDVQSLATAHGELEHSFAVVVGCEGRCSIHLERVERTAYQPHLIDNALLDEITAQGHVALVDGVEAPAVDANLRQLTINN